MSARKSPMVLFLRRLKGETATARETLAEEVYAPARIAEAMTKQAAGGYDRLIVGAPRPLDLSTTEAAKALVALLTGAGARCEWKPRFPDGPNGPRVMDLMIRWDLAP